MKVRFLPSVPLAAFTLVELLVSTAIIALIMLVLVAITNQTTETWKYTAEKIEKFQEARDGFESMTRRISQATLNTYWDYLDLDGEPRPTAVGTTAYNSFIPRSYGRMSSLRFISGPMLGPSEASLLSVASGDSDRNWPAHGIFFQAPLGLTDEPENRALNNLLNTWGYFVEVSSDQYNRPPFLDPKSSPPRWRSRLMEFMQPAEKMSLHDVDYKKKTTEWFSVPFMKANQPSSQRPVRTLSENVMALIILPKLTKQDEDARIAKSYSPTLSPACIYDSKLNLHSSSSAYLNVGATVSSNDSSDLAGINPKNQLPPIVQVTMIAIDDRSAERLNAKYQNDSWMGLKEKVSGLFDRADRLEDDPATAGPGDGDINKYERALIDEKLTYRVFTTNVSIRAAKWSRAQTK